MKSYICICVLCCLCARDAFADATVWRLSQRHAEFGKVTILVAPTAVKLINTSFDYQILAAAPTWKVVMYRTSEKKQCEMSRAYFTSTRVFKFLHPSRSLDKMVLTKLDAQKLGDLQFTHFKDQSGREEICLTDNIETSPVAVDIIEAYYNIKRSPGVPVRYTLKLNPKQKYPLNSWFSGGLDMGYQGLTTFLKTDEGKKVPYRASDFEYPQNYTTVKSPEEVMLSNKQQKSFDSLMDDMGLGSKLGDNKK